VLALASRFVLLESADVLVLAAGATVAAGLLHPIVAVLSRHLPRPAALVVTLLLLVGVVGMLAASIVGELRGETDRLRRVLPEAASSLEASDRFGGAARQFGLAARVTDVLDALPGRLTGGSGAAAVTTNAGRGVSLLAGGVLTIFLLLYGPRMIAALPRLLRRDDHRAQLVRIASAGYERAWRYAWARLGVAVGAGLVAYGLCQGFDVPGGVVLGVVVGLGSLVPGVGILVAGFPIVLLAAGLHGQGSVTLLLLGAAQVVETVVVQRRLNGRVLTVGPAPTLLAAIIGFEAGGVGVALLGMALVVTVAAALAEAAPGPSG
jgi:putative heme transporter